MPTDFFSGSIYLIIIKKKIIIRMLSTGSVVKKLATESYLSTGTFGCDFPSPECLSLTIRPKVFFYFNSPKAENLPLAFSPLINHYERRKIYD